MQDPRSFDIEDPVSEPLVYVPDGSEANWGCDPLPPPRASYKRAPEDIDDGPGVTSDWNFVMPT